jgi:hypothetical protein
MVCFFFIMTLLEGKTIEEASSEVRVKFLPTYQVCLTYSTLVVAFFMLWIVWLAEDYILNWTAVVRTEVTDQLGAGLEVEVFLCHTLDKIMRHKST